MRSKLQTLLTRLRLLASLASKFTVSIINKYCWNGEIIIFFDKIMNYVFGNDKKEMYTKWWTLDVANWIKTLKVYMI